MKTAAYHMKHNWGAQKGDKYFQTISYNLFVHYVNTIIALKDNIKITLSLRL